MKILLIIFSLMFLIACERIKEDPKVQKDSEEFIQDLIEVSEKEIEEELNMHLHKESKDAVSEGKE